MSIVDEFMLWLEAERRYSPLTVRNYRRDVESFLAWRGVEHDEFDPNTVKRSDIKDWAIHLFDDRELKPSSVNRCMASLRSLWKWMLKRGYAKCDVVHGISQFKTPKRLPTYVPETRMDDVVETLREDLASEDFERVRDAVILLLIYTCGLRLSELVEANDDDISPDFRAIRVMGKGGKERIQPVVAAMGEILKKYFRQKTLQNICTGQKKALILSKKGERINRRAVQRIVEQKLKSSGVQGKVSPHVLRHTFATHLLNDGADLRAIQELLGHSSLRATQVYTHTNIEKLKEVYSDTHPRESKW